MSIQARRAIGPCLALGVIGMLGLPRLLAVCTCPGDMNGDLIVNHSDLTPFVAALPFADRSVLLRWCGIEYGIGFRQGDGFVDFSRAGTRPR